MREDTTYPILVDTDPGLDDAIALLMLAAFAKERLDTVITSYGNVSLSLTTQNALRCCNLYDLAPHVIKGSSHPIGTICYEDAAHIHGTDGLGGVEISPAELPVIENDPIDALYQRIQTLGTVDYITLGPLTNLCLLLQAHPDVKNHLHAVTTMGGGLHKGNVNAYAEFNIYCDPIAANYVFAQNLPHTIVPLNTTHQVVLSMEEIYLLTRTRSVKSGVLQQILYRNYETNVAQGDKGCILHDASAVIAYLFPDCFSYNKKQISVITEGERIGETIAALGDTHRITETADRQKIFTLLRNAFA